MTTAYSYIRFSSPEQRKGDSLRRQQAESARWAEEHGLVLDTSLNINDFGTSAFRGKNVTDGGLAAFLAAIQDGTVKKGSFLLVENLDRLTRMEPGAAFGLLQSIVTQGITVVTLSDKRQYTAENLTRDISYLLLSLLTMHRAHEESRLKGLRVRAAWTKKKQIDARAGTPITNMIPSWLCLNKGRFETIEIKAAAVRRIFDLATEEGLGQRAIVTRLKSEGIPPIGKNEKWSETSVRRIIQNPAVIGIYQPRRVDTENPTNRQDDGEPIYEYYPSLISKQQFYYAQTLREKALIPRGPRGDNLGTIFTGLVFCGKCGSTMRRKGASKFDIFTRLRCSTSCGAPSWKYDVLHVLVIGFFEHNLMPHLDNNKSDRAQLKEKVYETEQSIKTVEAKIEKIIDAIQNSGDPIKALVERLKKLEEERSNFELELQNNLNKIKKLDARSYFSPVESERDGDGIREVLAGSPDIPSEKVRYALSRAIDKILLISENGRKAVRVEIGDENRNFDFDNDLQQWSCREIEWKTRIFIQHPISKSLIQPSP